MPGLPVRSVRSTTLGEALDDVFDGVPDEELGEDPWLTWVIEARSGAARSPG